MHPTFHKGSYTNFCFSDLKQKPDRARHFVRDGSIRLKKDSLVRNRGCVSCSRMQPCNFWLGNCTFLHVELVKSPSTNAVTLSAKLCRADNPFSSYMFVHNLEAAVLLFFHFKNPN